jgi:hypothetical protein
MDLKTVAFYSGVSAIAGTHVYLLNNSLPDAVKQQHAVINLVAVGLIVWASMR